MEYKMGKKWYPSDDEPEEQEEVELPSNVLIFKPRDEE